jgi:hypothetical protein
LASIRILVDLVSSASNDLLEARIVAYSRPPPLHQATNACTAKIINPPSFSATRLMRPLLDSRPDAVDSVRKLEIVRKDTGRKMGGGEDERRELPNKGGD